MEAKFIRTKPIPAPPSKHTVHASKTNVNQQKGEKVVKPKSAEEKEKDHLKEQYLAKLLASGFSKDNLKYIINFIFLALD
jgi:DNA recombination-dependent growth factor C